MGISSTLMIISNVREEVTGLCCICIRQNVFNSSSFTLASSPSCMSNTQQFQQSDAGAFLFCIEENTESYSATCYPLYFRRPVTAFTAGLVSRVVNIFVQALAEHKQWCVNRNKFLSFRSATMYTWLGMLPGSKLMLLLKNFSMYSK